MHPSRFCYLFLLLSLAVIPSRSTAAAWVEIGAVDSQFGRAVVELDKSSIKHTFPSYSSEESVDNRFQLHAKVRSAWLRISFAPVSIEGQTMSSTLMHMSFICDSSRSRTDQMIAFAGPRGTGKKLASSDAKAGLWTEIIPDTLQDLAYTVLCKTS